MTWDTGWAKYNDGGTIRNVASVREAAFAFRFKTASNFDARLEDTLSVPPGGTALLDEDNSNNGTPDLIDQLMAASTGNAKAGITISHDDTTNPATPLLDFSSRHINSNAELAIEYSPDLTTPFAPMFSIVGTNKSVIGNAVAESFSRPCGDKVDYTLRLDPSVFQNGRGFFRLAGEVSGEVPLAIWTFRGNSLAPVKLSELSTPLDATYMGGNSGIISSAGSFSFDDPITAWSGGQMPATALGTQLQTALVAESEIEVTRVTYSGFLWSDRAAGAITTVEADLVAWLNDALDTPGIVSPKRSLVLGNGGSLLTPFSVSYPVNGKVLGVSDKWDLRLRLRDTNNAAFTLEEEGFGIDTVTVFGRKAEP